MPDLYFAVVLVACLAFLAGWLAHGVYLNLREIMRGAVQALRKLYGWHRSRDAKRIADLEGRMVAIREKLLEAAYYGAPSFDADAERRSAALSTLLDGVHRTMTWRQKS